VGFEIVPRSPLRAANAGQRQPKANAKNEATRWAEEYSVCEGEDTNAAKARNSADSLNRFLPAVAVNDAVNDNARISAA
jgi:hypothetical protein